MDLKKKSVQSSMLCPIWAALMAPFYIVELYSIVIGLGELLVVRLWWREEAVWLQKSDHGHRDRGKLNGVAALMTDPPLTNGSYVTWKMICDMCWADLEKTIFLWTLKFWDYKPGGKSVNYDKFEIATKQRKSNI